MKHETIEKNVGLLMLLMAWNVWLTVRSAKSTEMEAAAQFSVEGAH